MSGGLPALALKDDDVTKLLASSTHIGATNLDFQMEQYVFKRRSDGELLFYVLFNLMQGVSCFLCMVQSCQLFNASPERDDGGGEDHKIGGKSI